MESCLSRYLQIVSTVPEKIKGEFNLWHKMVPFFCGKGRISTAKRSNKMSFIGLYGSFCSVAYSVAMVNMWWNKLVVNFMFQQQGLLEESGSFIVKDMDHRWMVRR